VSQSRAAVLSQPGAPLSWTSERGEGGRQRLPSAGLGERSEQCIQSETTRFSSVSDDESMRHRSAIRAERVERVERVEQSKSSLEIKNAVSAIF
jgi:hypothetical protein